MSLSLAGLCFDHPQFLGTSFPAVTENPFTANGGWAGFFEARSLSDIEVGSMSKMLACGSSMLRREALHWQHLPLPGVPVLRQTLRIHELPIPHRFSIVPGSTWWLRGPICFGQCSVTTALKTWRLPPEPLSHFDHSL